MPLNSKILDKIRCLYETVNEITKYWVHIETYKSDTLNTYSLSVKIYTFIDEKQASFYDKEIQINKDDAEEELQYAIDNIKELITPTSNEND
ncbi:MAG: hypothetical protein V8R81_01795 [Clostridia bacterium]